MMKPMTFVDDGAHDMATAATMMKSLNADCDGGVGGTGGGVDDDDGLSIYYSR